MNFVIRYWNYTRSPLYSLLFTLPFFLLYEIGIFFTTKDDILVLRNGADVLMRQILSNFGLIGLYWLGLLFFITVIITFYVQRNFWSNAEIIGNYFFFMMFESLLWSGILFFFMSHTYLLLMNPNGQYLIQQITLAIGAGIYEELLFRVLLISIIASLFTFIFKWNKKTNYILGIFISAGIFSAFHFIGEYGDYFSFKIFMVRFLAGIFLGLLFTLRGFGITAWSHSIYDLIVLTKITTE